MVFEARSTVQSPLESTASAVTVWEPALSVPLLPMEPHQHYALPLPDALPISSEREPPKVAVPTTLPSMSTSTRATGEPSSLSAAQAEDINRLFCGNRGVP